MSAVRALFRLGLVAAAGALAPAAAQVARVENTARLTYRATAAAPDQVVDSNTVSFDRVPAKRPTELTFHLLPPGDELSGFTCRRNGTVPAMIDATTMAAAPRVAALDITAPVIIELANPGGNHDPDIRERSTIHVRSGASATDISLLETAPDSGVFAGGFPGIDTPGAAACKALLTRGVPLEVSFVEDAYSYGSTASQLIDPAGYVFASADGTLVDGATVTLLDASGRPATVFGDDGVSRYPATMISGAAVTDASGRVYPAVPGRYRFPLAPPGSYTLQVVPPAPYRAPSTVTPDRLAALTGPGRMPFIINDASYGRSLTLAGQAPFYADLPLDTAGPASGGAGPRADLLLTKTASVRDASPGDPVQYRLTVENRGTTAGRALHITDTLPVGLRFRPGSARGGATTPTVSADGRVLDFSLPTLPAGKTTELSYLVTIAPGAPVGEVVNRARVLDALGALGNEASASVRIRPLLFSDAMTVIGRVTEGRCGDPADHRAGTPGVRLLLEDGTFTVTDRDGLYHFEGVRPGRHVVQLDTTGLPASHAPVACDADTRQAGSSISRFVEGGGGVLARVDFQLAPTGKAAAASAALPIAVADDASAAGNRDWLAGQAPGIDWLFPAIDHNPRAPALRVVVKHRPGQRVALTLNGASPDALAFDGSDTAGEVAVSRWTGLPLVAGDNRLVARVLDADGSVAATLDRTVHYAGAATRATFDAGHSRLVADGLTRPLLAVRVTDAAGRPVRAGTLVPFRVDPPYGAAIEADLAQARQLAGRDRAETVARVVGDDGLAFLALQPTTQAGAVHAVVALAEDRQVRTSDVRAWLAGAAREWVVVGFGAGTLGYDTLRRHGQPLGGRRPHGGADGQLAFYAKGRIKGSWLLTVAYDSQRRRDPDRGLLGTIDPDRYYTVYGDGSAQGYDAPTQRKLYVRVERPRAYALYGDLETGMTDTQLTRYSRTLNGVKAAYEGDRVRAVGVVAKPDTRYARDEIQGNGLTGPYRLSARGIVPNSDKLRIEVRDRFRSERIVSSRDLARHIDYDIDDVAGTVRFREPVLSRDLSLNPTFIVVDYEVAGNAGKLVAAARVAARLANGAIEVGAAAIRDESVGPDATVVGADVKMRVGAGTEVRAEVATGGHDGVAHGRAYLAEVEHHGAGVDVLAYARQQDLSFGVGQQNLVEAGTRKLGIDARIGLTDALSVTTTAWRQEQLDGPGTRVAGEARLEYRRATGTLYVGGQLAADQGLDGRDRDSRLLTVGATRTLLGGRLDLGAEAQVAPGGTKSSVDFPARRRLTAAYRVTPNIRLIGGYEIAQGQDFTTHTAQLGFDLAPWTGAKLSSTLNQQAVGENGQRTFAQYGLAQSLPLDPHWTLDATLDASDTIRGSVPKLGVVNAFQPAASGGFLGQDQRDGDYAAVTLGAAWRQARWSWNGRVEYRDATAADRFGVTSNLLRTLGEGKTLASSLRLFQTRAAGGATSRSFAADLALALRPLDSRWALLERLEWRHERADAGVADLDVLDASLTPGVAQLTTRVVNNLALNYRTGPEGSGHGLEATLYYGAKHITGKLADDRHDGFIDVTGFDLRRDLGHRLDLGIQGSVQHAWTEGAWTWSGGPSVGVSPGPNLWLTAGYNIAGYRDRDYAADRYTRAGPYLTLRLKIDQRSIGALAGRRR